MSISYRLIVMLALLGGAFSVHAADPPSAEAAARRGTEAGRSAITKTPSMQVIEDSAAAGGARLRIEGVDDLDLGEVAPGGSLQKAEALSELRHATEDDLSREAEAAERAAASDPSSSGAAYRSMLVQDRDVAERMRRDPELMGAALNPLRAALDGEFREAFSDCRSRVELRDRPDRMVGRTRHVQCEELKGRDNAVRERTIRFESEPFDNLVYASTTIVRDVLFDGALDPDPARTEARLELTWYGSVKSVDLIEPPTVENEWQFKLRITYNTQACAGVPENEPCRDRVQTAFARLVGEVIRLETDIGCAPEDCLLESDGFCHAEWACDDDSPREIGGRLFGPELEGFDPLFPGSTSLCWRATATYRCDYATGELCWDTPSGRRCVTNTDATVNRTTCPIEPASEDEHCRPVSRACAEDARGHGDTCYVETVTYACDTIEHITDVDVRTINDCEGAMRCLGSTCNPDQQQADTRGFADAHARLIYTQHLLNDYIVKHQGAKAGAVDPSTSLAPGDSAEWHPGLAYECRKALGGLVDCCKEPVPGALDLWFRLYSSVNRKEQAKVAYDRSDKAPGAWADFASGEATLAHLARGWTSSAETVTGGKESGIPQGAGDTSFASLQQKFIAAARAELQPQLSWVCSQKEFDLNAQREVGMCSRVGTRCASGAFGACLDKRDAWCCWSSPLTKSVREHMAGGQPGIDRGAFGTAKNPDCAGVSREEALAAYESESVPLEEFQARLEAAGALPKASTLLSFTDPENLTGSGSTIAIDDRDNAFVQTDKQFAEVNLARVEAALRREAEDKQRAPAPEPVGTNVILFGTGFTATSGGEQAMLVLVRQGDASAPASVRYATSDRTATAPRDYASTSGVVHWSAGDREPKLVRIATVGRPAAGDALESLDFRVLLSDASGAAIGAVDQARIRLNYRPPVRQVVPPRGELETSVSKRFLYAERGVRSGVILTWEIVYTSRGTEPLHSVVIEDEMPPGVQYPQLRVVEGPACTYVASSGQRMTCVIESPERAAFTSRIRVTAYVTSSGTWINRCGAQTVAANGHQSEHHSVEAGECAASGTVDLNVLPPVCPTAIPLLYRLISATRSFGAAFINFPAISPHTASTGLIAPRSARFEPFEVPADTDVSRALRVSFDRMPGTFASAAAISISSCPLDFIGLSDVNYSDPQHAFAPPACRYDGPPFALNGGALPGIDVRFQGQTGCVLKPGQLYNLNVLFVDARDGIQWRENACESAEGCGLVVSWRDENDGAGDGSQSSCTNSGDPLVAPAGLARTERTWVSAWSAPNGSTMATYPTSIGTPVPIGAAKNGYTVIPFVPTTGQTVNIFFDPAQPNWAIGYPSPRPAEGMFMSISPCAGDLRPANDASADPFVHSTCRLFANTGSIFYTTDTSATACKLTAGRQYYLNVAAIDTSDGLQAGEDSCGNNLTGCDVQAVHRPR